MQVFVSRVLVAAASLAALVASNVPPAAAAGTASHFVANGDSAPAFFEATDGTFIEVDVFRGGTPQNPQTMLFYTVCSPIPPFLCQEGFGLIPNRDFQGSALTGMSLNTDTSAAANPGFSNFGGSGGVISLTWTRTPDFTESLRQIMTRVFDNNTLRIQQNFNGDFASASVTGNILGVPLSPTFAELASQHSSEIDICKGC